MSLPRLLLIVTAVLFSTVLLAAVVKAIRKPAQKKVLVSTPFVVHTGAETPKSAAQPASAVPKMTTKPKAVEKKSAQVTAPVAVVAAPVKTSKETIVEPALEKENGLPEANRIAELFSIEGPKLPIVETVVYKSRVSWQKGRPAWLVDYARHYQTSRHFIARSLNGKPDYFKQDLIENARFNVYRKDKNIQFYLLVDISRCKMWLYYDDLDTKDRTLLKTYRVGLGRVDGSKASGLLTPIGKYSLGNKVAIYKPKMMGQYNNESIEMITVFGTRWIPFDKPLGPCSSTSKGLGIHGMPWVQGSHGEKIEDISSIGKYQSDGCIRLSSEDVDELFAVIITKPAVIELIKDFNDAKK